MNRATVQCFVLTIVSLCACYEQSNSSVLCIVVCMFIHGRPSGSNGTTDIYNQTTCKRMLHKIVSLLENSQHSQHSRPWRFVDQCLPASQITCRLGVPSAPVSGQHEQAYSPYRRTQNERHSSVQIKR